MRHFYDEWGKWMNVNPSKPNEAYPVEEARMVA
jgi:hypothetical protein